MQVPITQTIGVCYQTKI